MNAEELAKRYGVTRQYQRYDTQYQGEKEVIGWSLWDTNTYVSAATTTLRYFSTIRATKNLGNMVTASQLPGPEAFFLRAIRVYICSQPFVTTAVADSTVQDGKVDDLDMLMRLGVLELIVGTKRYGEWPIWMLPQGGGIVPFFQTGDVDVVVQTATNGIPDPRAVYTLSKPLFLAPLVAFYVDLNWPAGALTLDAGNTVIQVVLDGDMIRPVQ